MRTKKVFRWFWLWQEESEEEWLNEQSNKGWHLKGFDWGIVHVFEKGEPKNYIYRLDHNEKKEKELHDYIDFYESTGWEYVSEIFNGWKYFRQEAEEGLDVRLYIDDDESSSFKYKDLVKGIKFAFYLNLFVFVLNVFVYMLKGSKINLIAAFVAVLGMGVCVPASVYLRKKVNSNG